MYDLNEINERHGHYSSPYQDTESDLTPDTAKNDSTYPKQEIAQPLAANEPTGVLKEDSSNRYLSKAEAIDHMMQGKLITHRWFSNDEYMTMSGGKILLEDGVRCSPIEFWQWRTGNGWEDGYSLYSA